MVIEGNPAYNSCINPVICTNIFLDNLVSIKNNGPMCSSTSSIEELCTTSIDDTNGNYDISIAPNPSNGYLHVDSPIELEKCEIYSLAGTMLKTVYDQKTIDVSILDKGMYFLKVYWDSGETIMKFYKY